MNMKNIRSIVLSALVIMLASVSAFAQTALTQTSLNGAIAATGNSVTLLSGTGVAVGSFLVVDQELMTVTSVANTPTFAVSRVGAGGTIPSPHLTGAFVWVIPQSSPQTLTTIDPNGGCTPSNYQYLPIVNARSGVASYCNQVSPTTYAWGGSSMARFNARYPLTVQATLSTSATNAYTIKATDSLIMLTTTGTGSGSLATAINTWTLPSHVGLAGKLLTIKDASGGVTATTFIALSGTVDGAGGLLSNITLKTAYGGVQLVAGSGGWFTISCMGSLVCK